MKEQKALQQQKAEQETYGKIIFEDVVKSKIMLELKLFEFSKEDPIENETSELDESIEIDDKKENGTHTQEKETGEQIQEMDHYEEKLMEYHLDEEDRQIVLACEEIETKITTDLRIQSDIDEYLKQQTEMERELENEMVEKEVEEMIQDMNEYELKFLEYVHDEEDREILLTCEDIEMKIMTDLPIRSEVDQCLRQQTEMERELENEMVEKEVEERMNEMYTLEEKYGEYILDEEDREIIRIADETEDEYMMNLRNEPGTSLVMQRGKKRGAQQATTAIGTEDPVSTVSPAKNRRRRGAIHYTHKKRKTTATGSVHIVYNYQFVLHTHKNMLKGIVFSRN